MSLVARPQYLIETAPIMYPIRKIRKKQNRFIIYYHHEIITSFISNFKQGDRVKVKKNKNIITLTSLCGTKKEAHWRVFK